MITKKHGKLTEEFEINGTDAIGAASTPLVLVNLEENQVLDRVTAKIKTPWTYAHGDTVVLQIRQRESVNGAAIGFDKALPLIDGGIVQQANDGFTKPAGEQSNPCPAFVGGTVQVEAEFSDTIADATGDVVVTVETTFV